MTNTTASATRINHRDHGHPLTFEAREACRKAMRAGNGPISVAPATNPVNVVVGMGKSVHATNDDTRPLCGAGVSRAAGTGITKVLNVHTVSGDTHPVTCKNCLKLHK